MINHREFIIAYLGSCLLRYDTEPFAFRGLRQNDSVRNQTDSFLSCPSISLLHTRLLDVPRRLPRVHSSKHSAEEPYEYRWHIRRVGLTLWRYSALCREAVGKFRARVPPQFLSFHKVIINRWATICFILFYWIRYDPFRYISIIAFVHNSIN